MNRFLELEKSANRKSRRKLVRKQPTSLAMKKSRVRRARALTAPVNYTVPGLVPVLAQPSSMACWATVFTMLESWRTDSSLSIEEALSRVGQRWVDMYKANTGISSKEKEQFIVEAGLIGQPPASFPIDDIDSLLRNYGPIWITTDENPNAGWSIHARVITGIQGDGTPEGTHLHIIDPAGGRQYQEKFSDFMPKFEKEASRNPPVPLRIQKIHWQSDARLSQTNASTLSRHPMALTSTSSSSHLQQVIQQLVASGVDEAEIRAFLLQYDPQGRVVNFSIPVRAFEGMSIHLPGGIVFDGWKAKALMAVLGSQPIFMAAGASLAAILELCDRFKVTVGIGPAVAAGAALGSSLGVGILFAPRYKIGFYGSGATIEGIIDSVSASIQLTIIHGNAQDFSGNAMAMGGTLDLSEGPGIGVHFLFKPNGQFLGVTGELSASLGVPIVSAIEVFAQYQHTVTTLGLGGSSYAMSGKTKAGISHIKSSNDNEFQTIISEIRANLLLRFKKSDDPGLYERRLRLRELFKSVPPEFANKFREQLGENSTQDELSQLFHGELATATRKEMLAILTARAERAPIDLSTAKPEEIEIGPLSFPKRPLLPSMNSRFYTALTNLEVMISTSTDPRKHRYLCWVKKLRDPSVDDRVIEWDQICPRISNAASPFSTGCQIRSFGNYTSENDLYKHIRRKQDVVPANNVLQFMVHVRSYIVLLDELIDPSLHLVNFRQLHDQVQQTIELLRKMTEVGIIGDGTSTPVYYVAIRDWIRDQQTNPASLYSCR